MKQVKQTSLEGETTTLKRIFAIADSETLHGNSS